MKIRIKGNSIRYRLTKSDLRRLQDNLLLQEETEFPEGSFYYAIKADEGGSEMSATYMHHCITVHLPAGWITEWPEERVGYEHLFITESGKTISLLVEKDFKCLESTREDQADNFENPNTHCA